jgi:hypothetical protein
MALDTTPLNFLLPVFSFLFIFVLIYAVLAKTKVLGENKFIHIFISFLLAILFLVRTSLVEFVNLSAAWFAVFLVCIFFILLVIAFTHGKVDVVMNKGVAWVLVGLLIVLFIFSSSMVFNWALNWTDVQGWFATPLFGTLLLLVIGFIAAYILSKK